ncbi:hypothetical protein [Bremerella alba]|nr:hypothetical protein [Bremerella alba]
MISTRTSPNRWMVIELEGKPGQENAKILISGISQRVAQSYAHGYNQQNADDKSPLVRAVICSCAAATEMV